MEIETIIFWTTAIAVDIVIFTWLGKKLLAKWREMNADGEVTLDEVLDAVDDVVDIIQDAKQQVEGNHDGNKD